MFVLGNFLASLAELVRMAFELYSIILLVRILITWVNPDPFNPIVQFLSNVTDPVLEPLRRVIPPLGPLDISPLVAFLILRFLQSFLVQTLRDLSFRLR